MKVYLFLLASPYRGVSNEYTQYTIFNLNTKNHPRLSQICRYEICFQGTQGVREFETAVVNQLSMFEPLKLYCIKIAQLLPLHCTHSTKNQYLFLCPRRNFGWHIKIAPSVRLSVRPSDRPSVTNRVSAISHKLPKQI